MTVVKKLLSSGLIAGVIILCIGLFYAVIVAVGSGVCRIIAGLISRKTEKRRS